MGKNVSFTDIIHLSFTHRDDRKLRVAVWWAVKVLYKMWMRKNQNNIQLKLDLLKEIDWNLRLKRMSKSKGELENLRGIIEGMGSF